MSYQQPQPPPPPGSKGGGAQPAGEGRPQTLYTLLQVDPSAHPTIIRYAYRYLAGIYHPDNADTGNAEAFRVIQEAWKTLADTGRRMAYDAQIGLAGTADAVTAVEKAAGKTKAAPRFTFDRNANALSYNEVELRLAILQLLLDARKKRVQTGGLSAKGLMDVLNIGMEEAEYALWYLREKKLIERQEAQFMISVGGVDYLVDSLTKSTIVDQTTKSPLAAAGVQLPARIET
jgi:curved DNA-binding protein CbpA